MNPTQAIARMRQVLRRQHKSLSTEQTYVHWLRHFMGALSQMPPDLPSEQKVERFLTSLALQRLKVIGFCGAPIYRGQIGVR